MRKFLLLAMRHTYIFPILLFTIVFSIFTMDTKAQANFGRKEYGPTFITSPTFLNGIYKVNYPYYETTKDIQNKIPIVGISQFMGYQFSPYFMLGLGVEFDYWTKPRNIFVPIYLDLRVNMMSGDFAPHWYLNVGYGSRWSVDSKTVSAYGINSKTYVVHGAKSGIMLESGLGIKANVGYSNALILTFTAKAQESALKYHDPATDSGGTQDKYFANTYAPNWYIFLGVKAGIVF